MLGQGLPAAPHKGTGAGTLFDTVKAHREALTEIWLLSVLESLFDAVWRVALLLHCVGYCRGTSESRDDNDCDDNRCLLRFIVYGEKPRRAPRDREDGEERGIRYPPPLTTAT